MSSQNNPPFSSALYWEARYKAGLNSRTGSYGRLAQFKAQVINSFIKHHNINTIMEFGCGDGYQLSLFKVKNYIGIDVSATIVSLLKLTLLWR